MRRRVRHFIDPLLEVLPSDERTWLTVRNDDIYSFRWGDPAFARAVISQFPGPDVVRGFYMGPDGYCWGREAMDRESASPRQLVMQKQWFSFMLWGRLSYDPTLPDEHFQRILATHFPGTPADTLLAAWSAASRIFPEITRFFWGNIDIKWLPEACLSHPKYHGFYTVRHFVEGDTMPGEANISIREWRHRLQTGASLDDVVTPPQVAGNLRRDADEAMQGVERLAPLEATPGHATELRRTLGDIEAFADLGRYYAAKIDAACELAMFDSTSNLQHQAAAIARLEEALVHWQAYAETYTRQYEQPLLYNRVGWVDVMQLTDKVAADIELARNWKPGSVPNRPPATKVGGSLFGQ